MMPGLPASSIPQCKLNRHKGACLELFQATGRFLTTSFEAHQASKMIRKVRALQSRIETRSFLQQIISPSNVVFKQSESDVAVGIRKLGNLTQKTAEDNNTVQQTAGF